VKNTKRTVALVTGVAAAVGLAGAGVAAAAGEDATETPITGAALARASQVALAHTGQGTVTGTEAGDEEGAYEVEVTLDDGTETDVHLDENFIVLNTESDAGREADDKDSSRG
jgi:hypothetical protein